MPCWQFPIELLRHQIIKIRVSGNGVFFFCPGTQVNELAALGTEGGDIYFPVSTAQVWNNGGI